MASPKSVLSIRAARMSALSRCLGSGAPLTLLVEFQEELRSLGWAEDDVRTVGDAVLPLLIQGASISACGDENANSTAN
jgi:hypothetical protein